ncbi:MAG: hypothetical protein R2731_03285 [Nocardioides sp.]
MRGQFRDLDLAVAPSGAAVLGWEWLWHDWGGRLLVTHRRGPAAAWVTPRRWDGMWEFDALIGGSGLRAVAMHRQAGGRHRIQVIRGGLGRPWCDGPGRVPPRGRAGKVQGARAAVAGGGSVVVGWRQKPAGGAWRPWASRAPAGKAFRPPVALAPVGGRTALPMQVLSSDRGSRW